MNLEFQSAGKPTINGLQGINTRSGMAAAQQSQNQEKSAQFKDLLNQSRQDTKQAEQQLAEAQQNQREAKSTAAGNRQKREQTSLSENDLKTPDRQEKELVTEELNGVESQEKMNPATIDAAQLINIQNFQGGIETALTQLNAKLGLEENMMPEGLAEQGQIIELSDGGEALQSSPFLENNPQYGELVHDELQVLQQPLGSEENQEAIQGLLKDDGSELAATNLTNNEVKQTPYSVDQTSTKKDSELQIAGDVKPQNGEQAEELLSEAGLTATDGIKTADKTADKADQPVKADAKKEVSLSEEAAQSVIADSKKMTDITEELFLTQETKTDQTESINTQMKPASQTENQNPGEKGVQELHVSGINTGKAPEVQPDTRVAVAQQVEQKILQNFEPNKPMVLQMTLSPDNLGDIDIKLSYDQGKLIIDITAISQETQNLLGKQINLLVRGLALQNVQVETVHLNTPVEQSSDSQDASFLMNNGSDPNENKNQAQLRERFIKNSGVLNSMLTSSDDDESVMIPPNLQNYSSHKVNYLI